MAAKTARMATLGGMHTSGIFSDMTVDGPIIGTLVAIMDRAKNLPNRRSMGKQDPYCAARLGKEAKKTNTDKRGGQTPKWDQELRFTVHDSADYHQLKVSVFNDDKKTELIGETWISLEAVITPGGGQSDTWHGLNCKGKYAGEIRIELTFYDTRPKVEKAPVEKKKESTRPEGSPAVGGPRESTPVKRRPLPSDPTGASPSPVHTPEHRGLQGREAGPRTYGAPRSRQNEHTPTSQRRSHHPETPQRRPLPDGSPLNGTPASNNHTPQHQQRTIEQDPYSTPPNPRASNASLQHYNDDGFDMSYTAPKPYEVQPVDPVPQHARDPGHRTMSQDDFRSSRGHGQAPPVDMAHSYSAPTIPTHNPYDPSPPQAAYSQQMELYSGGAHVQQSREYSTNPYDDPSYHVEPLRMSRNKRSNDPLPPQDLYQGDPHTQYSQYASHGRSQSAMQPTVEDEDDPPPPPPVHRRDANTIAQHQQQQPPSGYHGDTPAPLSLSRYREEPAYNGYDSPPQPYGANEYAPASGRERGYTHPRVSQQPTSRPVSRDIMVPSPLRQETSVIPASLVAGYDASRQNRDSAAYQTPPSYETPPRLRQQSEPDFRGPQYETPLQPIQPHQLVHHQSMPLTQSPHYYPHAPPEEPSRTSPVHDPTPLIKPRAVSPSVSPDHSYSLVDNRTARAPVRSMPTRKSVSPRPPTSTDTGERRLSGVPFNPDSFDVLNPTLSRNANASGIEDERPGSSMEMNDKGQIVTFSGRVVDASDHLPVDSWAPEPEPKAGEKERPVRTRPGLTGARDLEAAKQREEKYRRDRVERDRIRDAAMVSFGVADTPSNALVTTRSPYSNPNPPASSNALVLAGSNTGSPGSGGRNRLQKRGQRPVSAYDIPQGHTPPSNIPAPNTQVLRERENVGGYGGRHAAPPIPAKIPLDPHYAPQSEDMSALSLELQSIDIGPGGGGGRRNRGTARRYGF
ncbi:hypothetical protein BS50DRAFT_485052 [Corynespora cassiicola Philippines]|uniref:C2 domain-containing protein n=1 Tax=Corynespora cassiicola Philippines TaxID=1448308 RepID=A0A2T2P2V3_CORCC|nr:hypothetical protein BS50DRAFT_485052 [Corynespora cassiicola Philippines]